MIVSTLKVSKLPRFPGTLTSLKSTSRGICNTTKMAKPDHSERTATEPRDPVRNGAARSFQIELLLTRCFRPKVAPHGRPQADRGGQPLHPHLPPRHPAVRGKHQGKRICTISDEEPCERRAASVESSHSPLTLDPIQLLRGPRLTHLPATTSSSQASG